MQIERFGDLGVCVCACINTYFIVHAISNSQLCGELLVNIIADAAQEKCMHIHVFV